jgi:phosphonatase-like hydrolase
LRSPELIIFDLGGTTIRDRGEVPAAFTAALRDAGIPFDAGELAGWRGASKREVLRRLVGRSADPMTDVEPVYRRFREELERRLDAAGELSLPGVSVALARLKAEGIRLAVASGFDRQVVERILAAVDWASLLDTWVSSEDAARGRPAPFMIFRAMERTGVERVDQVAVVGDTLLDLEAGWNAGAAYRIGVLSGAHDRETLGRGRLTHLVESVADVPDLLLPPIGDGREHEAGVREFRPEQDLPGVRRCLVELQDHERRLDPRLPPGSAIADAYLEALFRRCAELGGRLFVAESEGRVAGYVSVLGAYRSDAPSDDPSPFGYVDDLVVLSAERGRGLGRALLRRAERYAADSGRSSVRLRVKGGNRARSFYQREGYTEYELELEKRIEPQGRAVAEATGKDGTAS